MISPEQALSFGLAAFVLIAIPGPSVVFVVGRALAHGRTVALASVAGNSLGLSMLVVLVAFGLGAVAAESWAVFTTIKLAGAAYLVWLGIQALRHRDRFGEDGRPVRGVPAVPAAIRQGFLVGIGNPKGLTIFAALLPQFVDIEAGHLAGQMLLLGLVAVLIGLVSDAVWALLASRLRDWFARSPRRGEALGAVGSISMIGLGIALAVTSHD
ncbi:MAG: LysE family translocator [Aeromicrobium sp.]|uniref:LysE family translocator n=1 Tax=Aeromicrobium sp. TaxID=1871063 RepID=UPI0039E48B6F